jgi:hypothetical protein
MEEFKQELKNALKINSSDSVDVIIDTEKKTVYGSFHSRHDSHPVTETYTLTEEELEELISYCETNDICYCED